MGRALLATLDRQLRRSVLIRYSVLAATLFLSSNVVVLTPLHAQGTKYCLYELGKPDSSADGFGPYDYYNPPRQNSLDLVEGAHLTGRKTRLLKEKGLWCRYWSDLDYTLRAFPNHPHALMEMAKYLENHEACHPRPYTKTIECYFETAITFAKKYDIRDGNTRIVYGVYLHRRGQLDAALKQYKQAESLLPNSAEVHYNLGLLYADKKDLKNALLHVEKAYRLGYPLPGLRNQLVEAGVWKKNAGR